MALSKRRAMRLLILCGGIIAAFAVTQVQAQQTATSSGDWAAFTEVTGTAGLGVRGQADSDETLNTGQAWGDFDRDGWVDLYVTRQYEENTLFKNRGDGSFSVSRIQGAVGLSHQGSTGAVFGDYNNDGWLDLYVVTLGQDVLLRNEQGKGFTDVTAEAQMAVESDRGTTASWGDFDRDGFIDLFVANYGCPCPMWSSGKIDYGEQDRLYHNERDGTFREVTSALRPRAADGHTFVGGWLDFDNDRDLDLYIVNDVRGTPYKYPNSLFRNDGPGCGIWCFTDVSESSGADVHIDGMGLAVADVDNDSDLDMYMSNTGWAWTPLTGGAVLLRNDSDGTFTNVSHETGSDVDAIGWGTVFLDYDNDGWQDIYLALGFDPGFEGPQATRNRLLRNLGDGTFTDVTTSSGASDENDSMGVAVADFNNDGWVDLVVGEADRRYLLFANTGTAGQGNHRLKVRLHGAGAVNADAVGARVYLATSDGRVQLQEVMAGSSLGSGNDLALHFGVGKASITDLRVVWPDGRDQVFFDVPSDTMWDLTYGAEPSTSALPEPNVALTRIQPLSTRGLQPGGFVVPALAAVAGLTLSAGLVARKRRPLGARYVLLLLLEGAIIFQVAHLLEHVLQFGYWAVHPAEAPWITPWGRVATDGFSAFAGHQGGRASGTELLHLAGNWIFLAGLIAAYPLGLIGRHAGRGARALRVALWFQLVHVLEHVSLTATFFLIQRPIGLSTLFGLSFYLPSPWAPSIRIWWHFLMNLIVTLAAIRGLRFLAPASQFRPMFLGGRGDRGRDRVSIDREGTVAPIASYETATEPAASDTLIT